MPSENRICNCMHADKWHLQKIGPCTHQSKGDFCGCDHFQILRVQAPVARTLPALPMKKTALTPWSHQS